MVNAYCVPGVFTGSSPARHVRHGELAPNTELQQRYIHRCSSAGCANGVSGCVRVCEAGVCIHPERSHTKCSSPAMPPPVCGGQGANRVRGEQGEGCVYTRRRVCAGCARDVALWVVKQAPRSMSARRGVAAAALFGTTRVSIPRSTCVACAQCVCCTHLVVGGRGAARRRLHPLVSGLQVVEIYLAPGDL